MSEARPRRASRVTRRTFLRLSAAGAAAALAAPAATLARAATAPAPAKRAAKPAALPTLTAKASGRRVANPKEIEKLKGYLDGSLRAVRAFTLPPGSDMAFSFRAMKRRGRKEG